MGYLTSHVVASMGLVDVSAAPGTRARAFMNEIERLLLVGTPLLEDMCLILCARLSLVEWDLANKTVAGFAHAAGENVAIIFGEVGSYISSQHFDRDQCE
jgi:hypothetical protein